MAEAAELNKILNDIQGESSKNSPDYHEIEKLAKDGLNLAGDDKDLWKCFCVALLFQNKESQLAEAMKKATFKALSKQNNELRFYRAYVAYRQNNFSQALELLGNVSSVAAQHLRAQVSYSQDRFAEARDVYQAMDLEEDPEGSANCHACQLQLGEAEEVSKANPQRSVFHCQNVALGHMKVRNFEQATQLLEDAIELAETEELPSEATVELQVMLASCFEQNGQTEKARQLYESIQNSDVSNPILQLVILTNRVAGVDVDKMTSYDRFMILYQLRKVRKHATEQEKKIVEQNYVIMLDKCSQNNACRSFLAQSDVLDDETKSILCASLDTKRNPKQALKTVKKGLSTLATKGKAADNLKLVYATLLLQNKQKKEAIKALRDVEGLRHYPALVSTITEMLSGGDEEDVKQAVQTFDEAISFWTQSKKEEFVVNFQLQKADFLLKNKLFDEVQTIFQSLQSDENSLRIRANLIKATSFSDLEKGKGLAESLDFPSEDVPDAISLIDAGCVGGLGKRKFKLDRRIETIRGNTSKKVRKEIDPKHAARWEPKRKKKKKKNLFTGAQGNAV